MSIALNIAVAKQAPVRMGQAYYWSLMMDAEMKGQPFSVNGIYALCGPTSKQSISEFVGMLENAEIVRREVESAERAATLYRVVKRQSATPSFKRDGTLIVDHMTARQALWNAMRSPFFSKGFSLVDITKYASTDTLSINERSARNYILRLVQAEYLIALQRGTPAKPAIWRLVRNTGPASPKLLKTHVVYDPNAEKIFGKPETVEVEP